MGITLLTRRNARRLSAVCSALGALAVASATLAPEAVAVDVQSKEWYLDAMGADDIWKISTGKGVKVAVVDSGVNPATSSLKGQVLVDEVPKSVSYHVTHDNIGHGTSMAEIIAGTGAGGGIKGLAPGAKIIPFRIASAVSSSDEAGKTPSEAEAIRAAADSDAKIINMSFAAFEPNDAMKAALKYGASKGKLMFVSIGNEGDKGNLPSYPAVYPYAVGVAALDKSGTVGGFSSYGGYVDLAAPGLNIPSWCDGKFDEYCDSQGTSPASAIASASAALIWSAHPDWTGNQVLRTLIDTAARDWAKDKPSKYLGYGGVRPRRVLIDKNIDPGPADVDPLAKENGGGSSAAPSPSAPSPSAGTPSGKPAEDAGSTGGPTSAAAKDTDSGSGSQTWVIIGAVAAVLVIGGAGFAVLRARRNS
ncbi:S8 family serine peptidase [Streptomyces sp. 5-8]|uniref:S8 family serine peptidase n=1 Tax=Streptomyces musisoli TaxID=2802280 RepID=A0ABS1P7J5_9ACTN|nr:S8 family serine peptidase [Streptomyces musisoli]MBL1108055.1 S8 family serine peptidase [Streptomyces musisoli]